MTLATKQIIPTLSTIRENLKSDTCCNTEIWHRKVIVQDLTRSADRPSETKRFEKSWKLQDIRDFVSAKMHVYTAQPKETYVYAGLLKETCIYTLL